MWMPWPRGSAAMLSMRMPAMPMERCTAVWRDQTHRATHAADLAGRSAARRAGIHPVAQPRVEIECNERSSTHRTRRHLIHIDTIRYYMIHLSCSTIEHLYHGVQ